MLFGDEVLIYAGKQYVRALANLKGESSRRITMHHKGRHQPMNL